MPIARTDFEAGEHQIRQGERVDDRHELVERYPFLFEPDDDERRQQLIEQARSGALGTEMADFSTGRHDDRGGDAGLFGGAPHVRAARDEGLRTIERAHQGPMEDHAAEVMEQLVRDHRDPSASTARYLRAVAAPHYRTAWLKWAHYASHGQPEQASLHFSRDEHQAWMNVVTIEHERAGP